MNNFEFKYIISENSQIDEVYKAAMGNITQGSLVLLVVSGNYISFTDKNFSENIFIKIEENSNAILFNNCTFNGKDILIKNHGNRILFNECYFAGGKTFIENSGYAVYNKCVFSTNDSTSVLFHSGQCNDCFDKLVLTIVIDSDIKSNINGSQIFITDKVDNITMINTKINADETSSVIWTKEIVLSNVFAYYNCDYIFGSEECGYQISKKGIYAFNIWNLLRDNDQWDPLSLKDIYKSHENEIFFIKINKDIMFTAGEEKEIKSVCYPSRCTPKYNFICEENVFITEKSVEDNIIYLGLKGVNDSEEPIFSFLSLVSENELKADSVLEISPSIIEPPKFLTTPVICIRDGRAYIEYEIDLDGREDQSDISWYRVDNIDRTDLVAIKEFKRSNEKDCRKIAVSRQSPCREIALTPFDIGKHLKVNIKPKHNRSSIGASLNIMSRIIMATDIKLENIIINVGTQVLNPYYKLEPGYGTTTGIWFYKRLPNNKHYGMVTGSNSSGFYFSGDHQKNNMTVFVVLDLENPGGEGFNVEGEFQEIYIKYDVKSKCGFGLRYECVNVKDHLAGFSLYKYEGLKALPISDMVIGSYLLSGIEIKIDVIKNQIIADITVPGAENENFVLNSFIEENSYNGTGIKHNVVSLNNNRIGIRNMEIKYFE